MATEGGWLTRVPDVASRAEGTTRALRIYVPRGVDLRSPVRVLYMQDAQNLFDRASAPDEPSWGVDDALDDPALQAEIGPWIVVAVEHRGPLRIGDYSPWRDRRRAFEPRASRYATFLAEELVPYIEARFPVEATSDARAIAGSSLGGLVSLYTAWRYPERFSRVGAFSPSVMWGERQLFRFWSRHPEERQRIYVDVGSRERFRDGRIVLEYGTEVRDFVLHLRALGYGEDEVRLVLDPEGEHHEMCWRRRFHSAARWLLRPASRFGSLRPPPG